MQLPILLKLAEEYQGKFLLAKLDTERERELTKAFQIRSIPTMKLFKNGEIVEDILGAQTETTLREMLARHIPRESDSRRLAADQAYQQGDLQQAMQLLRELVQTDPDNHKARLDLARIAIQQGQLEEAENALAALAKEVKDSVDAAGVYAQLAFARIAQGAPSLEALRQTVGEGGVDLESNYQLAARLVMDGDYQEALEILLEVMQTDRSFRDDGARKGLLTLFQILGDQHELTSRYRKQMFNLLH